ncbi:MAG: GNAT family N-acetyltransferase [Bacteroidia bacterium]|nr:GNAT family N-acetyltransferase [Bacteroidia bacterium]
MIHIRMAMESDMDAVHALVRELAEYEKAPEAVKTTAEIYKRDGFQLEKPLFHCFVAENEDKHIIGIALFYFAYSTWKGKMLYLDDLVVSSSFRRQGIGKKLFDSLVSFALENDAQMMKWQVLDWNKPAIEMYKKLNTVFDSEWIDCKLYKDQLSEWTFD